MSIEGDAKRAFAALQALDPDSVHRAELRAAGVSENRIAALYGRPFVALVPHIIAHIKGVQDADLMAHGVLHAADLDDLLASISRNLYADMCNDDDADEVALSNQGMLYALMDSIAARFEALDLSVLSIDPRGFDGNQIESSIWNAHWLMTNRDRLSRQHREAVDKIMVAVAHTIGLQFSLRREIATR